MSNSLALRVTSIWQNSTKLIVFAGVQLNEDNRIKSAKHIVVVNALPEQVPMQPAVGQHWLIDGVTEKKLTERNGYQVTEMHITPERCQITLPADGEQFIRFIAAEPEFKGIGEVKARELWHIFGAGIYDIMANEQSNKLTSILTTNAIVALFSGYKKYANLKYANWFAEQKIPPVITQRLFKYHGENAVSSIKEDPYRLLAFGMSFSKVDALACARFDTEPNDLRRLVGAVEYVLQQHTLKGHTVAMHKDLMPLVTKLLHSKELADKALLCGHKQGAFVYADETGSFHPSAMLIMEHVIAKRFHKLKADITDWQYEHDLAYHDAIRDLPYQLTAQQAGAVHMAMANGIACITGGAGTGKTTVLRTVLRAYNRLQFLVKAIALSGRAAMRLHESTGFTTSTIAKFLREDPLDSGNCLVVIDEASMIDLQTMYRIVTHINPSTRLLFVGDPEQLPPISAGLILADIVKSGVIANTMLDIVKRQEGATGIPEYSNLVKLGQVPPLLSTGCIRFHDVPLAEITNVSVNLFADAPYSSQIIGATYSAEHGGIDELNRHCQALCNSAGQPFEFNLYGQRQCLDIRVNDPVIFTQNDYDAGVQNGTLGWLISAEQTESHFGTVRIDTGEDIRLTQALLDSIRPGYAISLHKAQGSQFQRVIVPITNAKMLDRNWIYTAITRSMYELHLVGPAPLFAAAIKRVGATIRRQTHLSNLLQ